MAKPERHGLLFPALILVLVGAVVMDVGSGHSPVQQDVLYAVTRASDLTERDRKTARLLYSLPPGSLR